jgi:hypothetical protein
LELMVFTISNERADSILCPISCKNRMDVFYMK